MLKDLNLRKAIELAITTEQLGAKFYERMVTRFSDEQKLKEIFATLAQDEKKHEVQFKGILKTVPEKEDEPKQHELYQYLRATAISEFFREDYFKKMADADSRDDLLGRALEFEKATLQYYQAIRDILGESSQIDGIIDAEKTHVINLMKVIMTDAKFRGLGDKWT